VPQELDGSQPQSRVFHQLTRVSSFENLEVES
jgi:hypothetical protein